MNWYTKHFTPDEIEATKTAGRVKQAILAKKYGAYNNLVHESAYRWIGDLGELAFHELMTTKYPYIDGISIIRHTQKDDYDDRDFTISANYPIIIDVKTSVCRTEPRPEYLVNLNANQYQKLMEEQNLVNTFVFARFNEAESATVVLGWILKADFAKTAKFLKAGTQSNKIVINSDVYCLPISSLKPFAKALS